MNILQSTARAVAEKFGRESSLIRWTRPAYESALNYIYRKNGLPWAINGVEYRIEPRMRCWLPQGYEAPVAQFLRKRLRDGQICFDIGANTGVYVLQFAHWTRPSGRVVAFEPNPVSRGLLQHHIRLNQLSDRVTVVPAAVGRVAGKSTLYAAGSNPMSRLNDPHPDLADRVRPLEVDVIAVDQYIEQSGVWPDALVVDIEGYEIEALQGAKRLIQEKRDLLIVVEMHMGVWPSANTTRESAEALLDELQLQPVPLEGQRDVFADHGAVHLKQRER